MTSAVPLHRNPRFSYPGLQKQVIPLLVFWQNDTAELQVFSGQLQRSPSYPVLHTHLPVFLSQLFVFFMLQGHSIHSDPLKYVQSGHSKTDTRKES